MTSKIEMADFFSAVDRCNLGAIITGLSLLFWAGQLTKLGKSYVKNITGLAVGILAMGHTRQCAYTSTRAEALVLV